MGGKGFQAGLSLVLGWGELIFHWPEWDWPGAAGTDSVLLIKEVPETSLLKGCLTSHTAACPVLSWNRFSVFKGRGRDTASECFAQKTVGFLLPLFLNSSCFHLNQRILFPEAFHFSFFLSDSISQSRASPGLSKKMTLILGLSDFKMNRNQQKEKRRKKHCTSVRPCLTLTAQGPPPALLFE